MIYYKFEEEKQIVLHYAHMMKDEKTIDIINLGSVAGSEEAEHLSRFFWDMVGLSIIDSAKGVSVCGLQNVETWNEYIMESFRRYFHEHGFSDEWNRQTELA
ncbi:hypothetical protein [Hahella ganghwensis]|uniref:hypothetical protein n=1 Tax=Hahella ganghwensis TaxID=286420 RepID=UPI00036A8A05|nr:hypothetical protein [Hahella ganghwensis]